MKRSEFKRSFDSYVHEGVGLSVYKCGLEHCAPSHTWGPALRDHYLIQVVESGRGIFRVGGREYTLGPGDGFLICPSQMVEYSADSENPWSYYWVGFNGSGARRLIESCGLSEEEPVFHSENPDKLLRGLLDIYKASGASPQSRARMVGALYFFLAQLMEERGAAPANTGGTVYLDTALTFMEQNYSRKISVGEIAASCGLSRSHLYRLFMAHANQSPNEYLIRLRVDKAAHLLREKGLTVSEAAYSAGFTDPYYFSRIFKKIIGVSPSEYAKCTEGMKDRSLDKM